MKTLIKLTAVAAGLTCAALSAQAQTVTLKVHHFLNATTVQHTKMLRGWCDNLAKDSGNKLQCNIFPSMQLGGTQPQLFDQARTGVADVVWTLPSSTAGRFPKMEVFELPFTMTTAEATSAAAWDYYDKNARDEFKDVKVVAMHVHGPGVIFSAKKPITTMADMKGMKVRAPTRMVSKLIASVGGVPVGMPVPGIPDALSKGVLDGAVTTYEVSPSIKLNELTKHVTETDRNQPGLYTTLFVVAMNKAKYESLTPELKKVVDKHSGRDLSVWMGKILGDNDVPGKDKFIAAKNTVNVISAAELEKWKQASSRIDDEWIATVAKKGADGNALLADARALIQKHTAAAK